MLIALPEMIRTLLQFFTKLMIVTISIICILILIFTKINIAEASDHYSNYDILKAIERLPPRAATWKNTPTIIVCEHAPISEVQISSAVAFWKNLGHKFFRTQYKHDRLDKCNSSNPIGYIVIHLETLGILLDPGALAETHFYVNNNINSVEWAIIYMRNSIRPIILEHEIGHALGYLHYEKIGHLMNSTLAKGGWNTEGLENSHQ